MQGGQPYVIPPVSLSWKSPALILGANLAASLPFIFLLYSKRLYIDFWLDEVISIRRHIITTIDRALFWYPIPNNHVFTNALSGLYLQLVGGKDLSTVLENPEILRTFYASFGLAAILTSGYIAFRFVSRTASLITVILWTTTIPFLNFAAQVRGYSPSFFFIAILILSILLYKERPQLGAGIGIFFSSAALFYTMPSNIYLLAGLIFFLGIAAILGPRLSSTKEPQNLHTFLFLNPALSVAGMIALGCLLALLLYSPILDDVLDNRYIEPIGPFRGTAFSHSMPAIYAALISKRWLLFAFAALGWLGTLKTPRGSNVLWLSGLLGAATILPFLFSFARGDDPPARTFLFIMPAFFLLTAVGLDYLIRALLNRAVFKWTLQVLVLVIFGYSNIVFFTYYNEISNMIRNVLVNEDFDFIELRDDRLSASVHLDHYAVRNVLQEFSSVAESAVPIFVDADNTRYDFALTTYMKEMAIESESIENLSSLSAPRVYLFLSYSKKAISELQEIFPAANCEVITQTLSLYKALDCYFR